MAQSRYHRQMLLPEVDEDGQNRLARSHALLVGCGALGCTIADLLVRAGVGVLTIVDRDVVEITNLQRQSLFDERDVAEGLPKAAAAQRRLAAVNASVRVRGIVADFSAENAERFAAGEGMDESAGPAQVIIDGTDNFEARYLMNDLAVKHGTPYVYGGAVGMRGMQMTILSGPAVSESESGDGGPRGPCLRCIFEEAPAPGATPTCDTAGIFAPVATIVAACEAADALKILMGKKELTGGSLLEFDLWRGARRRIDSTRMRRSDCVCCGRGRYEYLEGGRGSDAAALCGRRSIQVMPRRSGRVDLAALADVLGQHGMFTANRFLVRGEFEAERGEHGENMGLTVFADGRALVHGTTDPTRARAIYSRYIGG